MTQESENLPPGVYFGLAEDIYHAQPYLSASGMKNLLVSPMDYWARSWMNPWREEDETESEAKTLGKAYHKRILEGKAAFDAEYAPQFQCDGDTLDSNQDLIDHLKALGISGYSGKKKEALVEMVLDADPMAKIKHVMEQEYLEQHPDKIFLNEQMIRKIELSARMIEYHPALKYYFVGGQPEVSVIWHDEEHDLMFKARFDYLKIGAINDLKTFANMMGKSVERAVYGALASGRYHIQATLYLEAVDRAKHMMMCGGMVYGHEGIDPEWLNELMVSPEHEFNFLFQQKGPAPVSIGAQFSRQDPMFEVGQQTIISAVDIYKRNLQTFGTDPWVDTRDPIMLHYQQYPSYAMDI